MGKPGDVTRSYRWTQLRKRVLAEEDTCWICGLPLDHGAPPKSRWSPSVDHVIPLVAGGDPYSRHNLRAAHLGCNSRKNDKTEGYTPGTSTPSPSSRRW